jgi:ketosteroid isomerase-like protein
VKEGSLEFWDWFYEPSVDDSEPIEDRWHRDLVVHQSPDLPGTAGTFRGYEGLRQTNRELIESYGDIRFRPREAHELDGGRWLVLLTISGRGRGSGIEMEGEVGHIVTLRDGRATQLDIFLSWAAAREAAGLA